MKAYVGWLYMRWFQNVLFYTNKIQLKGLLEGFIILLPPPQVIFPPQKSRQQLTTKENIFVFEVVHY